MNTTRDRSYGTPEIIVAERVVLLRIQNLEQRRARVALNAGAEFVDLVEHHHAVARAGLADRLDDVARQRADIGAPVAADFRLVVDAAERHAHELAAHGARDRLAERGLADAGRTDEAQDRRLALRRELAHGEIFDDAPLDLFQIIVVLVEDAARFGDVDRLLLGQSPRQFDQPVEIGAHHAVFAGGFRHALQPAQFLARLILDLLRHLRVGNGLVELGHFGGLALFAFAELLLNRRHLLAQHGLALALVERRLGLLADLLRQPQDLDAVREQPRDLVHAGGDVDRLQDLLLLLRLDVHVAGRQIGERRRGIDRLDGGEQVLRHLRQELNRLHGLRLEVHEARLDLRPAHGGFGNLQHARDHERPAGQILDDLKALFALADEMIGAVRRREVAHDIGDGAHAMHVDRRRIGDFGIALHENPDLALVAHRLLRGGHRFRPAERDRQHKAGEQHGRAHRHDDQRVGRQRRQCPRGSFPRRLFGLHFNFSHDWSLLSST